MESWWKSKRHLVETCEWQGDVAERESRFEEECEKVLMQTYNQLTKVVEYLPQVLLLLLSSFSIQVTSCNISNSPALFTA